MRKARASEASVFASSSTMRRCAILQFDPKRRAAPRLALDGYPPSMIADYGLHNGQAQARTMLLGRVVGSKQALALLLGEARAGVGDFEANRAVRAPGTHREDTPGRHGVERVEPRVLERGGQLRGGGVDRR